MPMSNVGGPPTKRPTRRLVARLVVGVAAASLTAAGCGPTGNARAVTVGRLSRPTAKGSADSPPLPKGFSSVAVIAGDRSSAGLWLVAQSSKDVRVFDWRPTTHRLRSWSLGNPAKIGGAGAVPFSIGRNDRVIWAAVQDRIFRLVPRTGRVTSFAAPAQPVAPGAPVLGDDHNPVGIAAAPDGDLAIAETATAAVTVVSTSGAVVSTIRLPKDTAALAVAYDTAGDLGVALLHYPGGDADAILLHPAKGGWRKVRVTDGSLTGESNSFLTGFDRDIESVNATTGRKVRLVPTSLVPRAGPHRPLLGMAPLELGSYLAYGTASGVAVYNTRSRHTQRFTFPTFACGNMGAAESPGRSNSVTTAPPTTAQRPKCLSCPMLLTSDARGDIWYQSSAPGGAIDMISRSSYRG
jgi:hypothetical protein